MRARTVVTGFLLAALLVWSPESAGEKKKSPGGEEKGLVEGTIAGLRFRSLGPALTSGRVGDLAVRGCDPTEYYAAVASGGVWKTTNAGTTFEPVFDGEGSYSIGCVALDERNPARVWVGTGENNSQRSVSYGDGVYRSDDGGKSWTNTGLKRSEHIGKILVDPRSSDIVYAAAQGPLWGPGGDRGLYKTTDGGGSWNAVLSISPNTGVTDIAMDPRNPDLLYAASYQRRRHVWTLINGGPESALYKSEDGGKTWRKLTRGLPAEEMGRIGLALSPVRPDVVFALIELAGRKGGVYRSTDRGESWEKRGDYASASAQYYSELVCDPLDPDRIYSMDVYLKVSQDGGRTWRNLGEKAKHVDNHALWVNPQNTSHYLAGGDGGLYESFDRGRTWKFLPNLPVTQFYRVTVDNALPFYNIYGGTQDNCTIGGPSRTVSSAGVNNCDWFITTSGDGFETQVDPEDPGIVYSQSQYGGLVRHDRRSGEITGIRPVEGKGEPPLRWNWDSPLIISPHAHTRLYFAANILFRSDDRGDSWIPVSGDLTRALDRNALPVMGTVWGVDAVAKNASTSLYGNITALSESPVAEGILWTGSDDGLIHVSENGGAAWRKIEGVPGVPERAYVSRLEASRHDARTVYAAFDHHKEADFRPYLYRSTDAGRSWSSIAGNLPANGPVYALAEDHGKPELLFAGTEFGVFCTVDGGKKWIRMTGGLPTIAVRDIDIQRRENDLVLGTFGRGFYVLDDYAPLRDLTETVLEREAHLFGTRQALMYIQSRPYGYKGKAFLGETFYMGENLGPAAILTYYLKEDLKTRKERRQALEKEARKRGDPAAYPSWEELRREDEEEPPAVLLTITDEEGNTVRRLTGGVKAGIHRVEWDLRYAPTTPASLSGPDPEDAFAEPDQGPFAMPGVYRCTVSARVDGTERVLAGPVSFTAVLLRNTTLPAADRGGLSAFQMRVGELQRAAYGAGRLLDEMKGRMALLRKAAEDAHRAPAGMAEECSRLEGKMNLLLRRLRGDRTLRSRNEGTPPSIMDRIDGIVGDQWLSSSAPTLTMRRSLEAAEEEFEPLVAELRGLAGTDMKALEESLEGAAAPWTPGRIPMWKRP
ncbi:MAG: glycosyl hydrolase [Bacteroidota bacterium]